MTLLAFAFLVSAALLTGGACQVIGRSRAPYEWEIGTVGALYGGLLFISLLGARFAPGFVFDGLAVVPMLLGAVLGGGLLVVAFRAFGSPIAPRRRAQSPVAAFTISRLVRATLSPVLIEQPIVDRMRRQCGVTVTVGRMDMDGAWLELRMVGVPEAVDAAIALAQHAGVKLAVEVGERAPALAA